jgi:hypothetical protein
MKKTVECGCEFYLSWELCKQGAHLRLSQPQSDFHLLLGGQQSSSFTWRPLASFLASAECPLLETIALPLTMLRLREEGEAAVRQTCGAQFNP